MSPFSYWQDLPTTAAEKRRDPNYWVVIPEFGVLPATVDFEGFESFFGDLTWLPNEVVFNLKKLLESIRERASGRLRTMANLVKKAEEWDQWIEDWDSSSASTPPSSDCLVARTYLDVIFALHRLTNLAPQRGSPNIQDPAEENSALRERALIVVSEIALDAVVICSVESTESPLSATMADFARQKDEAVNGPDRRIVRRWWELNRAEYPSRQRAVDAFCSTAELKVGARAPETIYRWIKRFDKEAQLASNSK